MTKQIKADLFLLLLTAIWGSSFTLMKNVLDHIPSFAYLSLRFIIAAVVLFIIFYKKLRYINKKIIIYGAVLGIFLFGGMAFQVIGLYTTTASNSAFITGLNVIMVPIVSSMLLRKKPDKNSVIGVILAFLGLFFLWGGLDILLSGGKNIQFKIGDFYTLLCAISFTFHIILIDKFTNDHDPAVLSVIQIGFAAIMYTVVWMTVDYKPIVLNKTVIIILIITGLLGTALAFAGQTIVQRFTSPTRTVLIFTAEPVFGAIFAMLIPNSNGITETLKINSVIGCILILAGMLLAEFKTRKKVGVEKHFKDNKSSSVVD